MTTHHQSPESNPELGELAELFAELKARNNGTDELLLDFARAALRTRDLPTLRLCVRLITAAADEDERAGRPPSAKVLRARIKRALGIREAGLTPRATIN